MASAPESESAAAMLQRLLGAAAGAGQGSNLVLVPMMVVMVAPPQAAGDLAPPPPNRVMLINPVTQQAVMLQGDLAEMLMEEGGNPGVPPASKAAIKGLRTVEGGEVEKEESCPVCLDEYGVEMEVKEMPFKHRFHEGCIEKWLGMHGSCPVCRFEMQSEQEKVTAAAMQVDEPERVATPVEEERSVTMEAERSSGWGQGWEGFDHSRAIGVQERMATDSGDGRERDHTRTILALIELWQRRATGGH